MKPLIVAALLAAFLQAPAFRVQQEMHQMPDGTTLLYGRAVPGDYDPKQPRPLVLALAEAVHTIQRGVADYMIVGACGSPFIPCSLFS